MENQTVQEYFNSDVVVSHYEQAARLIGLWESEEKIFVRLFKKEDSILELGCGAGRIAMGLYELGYKNILATDFAKNMVKKARYLAKVLNYAIPIRQCDALVLEFEDSVFEGVIFGFNGLMQIPKKEQRAKAIEEMFRVLKPGGFAVFTSHLRSFNKHKRFWEKEKALWKKNKQNLALDDFGDRFEATDMGDLYIHVPDRNEIEKVVKSIGFKIEALVPRSVIANESPEVREFSDECVFWVLRKPQVQ